MLVARSNAWRRSRSGVIKSYFQENPVRKVQVGAGSNFLEGWLNTDVSPRAGKSIYLDVTQRWPFEDNSVDVIFGEHVIEHIPYAAGIGMLRECHLVLRSGGVIRLATPDLSKLIGLKDGELSDTEKAYVDWIVERFVPEAPAPDPVFVLNNAFHNWGHQFLYSEEVLRDTMGRCGFVSLTRRNYGESDNSDLRGVESHGAAIGALEMARFETMAIEGVCIK